MSGTSTRPRIKCKVKKESARLASIKRRITREKAEARGATGKENEIKRITATIKKDVLYIYSIERE